MLEHPEIGWIERTGYPSWMQERDDEEFDEDALYEEKKDERIQEVRESKGYCR